MGKQGEYSIVVDVKLFTPEQFAEHHFEREFNKVPYKSMDPTDQDNRIDDFGSFYNIKLRLSLP